MGRVENLVIEKMHNFAKQAVENFAFIESDSFPRNNEWRGNYYNDMQYAEIHKAIKSGMFDDDINCFANPEFPSALMSYIRSSLKVGDANNRIWFEDFYSENPINLAILPIEKRFEYFDKLIAFCSVAQMGADLKIYTQELLSESQMLKRFTGDYLRMDMPGKAYEDYKIVFDDINFKEGEELIPIDAEIVRTEIADNFGNLNIFVVEKDSLYHDVSPDFKLVYDKKNIPDDISNVFAINKKDWELVLFVRDGYKTINLRFQRNLAASDENYYAVYNVSDNNAVGIVPFDNYERMTKTGTTDVINVANYKLGYAARIDEFPDLDDLYMRLNVMHPSDYYTYSLSVGDVIAVNFNGDKKAYFVDSFGFKKIDNFFEYKIDKPKPELLITDNQYYVYIQECSEGYDYTFYDEFCRELDGGVYDDICDIKDAKEILCNEAGDVYGFKMNDSHEDADIDSFMAKVKDIENVYADFVKETARAYNEETLGVSLYEIKHAAYKYIEQTYGYDFDVLNLKRMCLVGSYCRGLENDYSDIDIAVEYRCDGIKEDAVFNELNNKGFEIAGKKVDFIPINNAQCNCLEYYLVNAESYLENKKARYNYDDAVLIQYSNDYFLKVSTNDGQIFEAELYNDVFEKIYSNCVFLNEPSKYDNLNDYISKFEEEISNGGFDESKNECEKILLTETSKIELIRSNIKGCVDEYMNNLISGTLKKVVFDDKDKVRPEDIKMDDEEKTDDDRADGNMTIQYARRGR